MRMDELLSPSRIVSDFNAKDRKQTLRQLAKLFSEACPEVNQRSLFSAMLKREELGSTGIGSGIAIPHAVSEKISKPVGFLAISKEGSEFNALDGEPVHIFFLIVYPQASVGMHLKVLSRVAKLLREKFVRDSILEADSPDRIIRIFEAEEAREKACSV